MQKRSLVIFGLILISVLLISGCQQAVGGAYGNKNRITITDTSAVDSTITRVSTQLANDNFNCNPIGKWIIAKEANQCYKVLGCQMISIAQNNDKYDLSAVSEFFIVRPSTGAGEEIECRQGRPETITEQGLIIMGQNRGSFYFQEN